ncbi:MAG: amidohydrolase family protein [Bifidobacteriaceae bacterium]|nr:amidohydrolase family protein [Bifidobacteriaceae bacterium]
MSGARLRRVALGEEPADLVVQGGTLVNVYTLETYPGGVAVADGRIVAVGEVGYAIGPSTQVVDAEGLYVTPGFVDAHIHPESTSLAIREFAKTVLLHGTTTIFTDLHEIGVVAGLPGIEAVLDEAAATHLKLYLSVPSHVPFSPDIETTAGRFDSEIIARALDRPDAVGLSEIVSLQVLAGHEDLLRSLAIAKAKGKSLQGHLPQLRGRELAAVLTTGVTTDHEAKLAADAVERLRAGLHIQLRQGSLAHGVEGALGGILASGVDTNRLSIVTDDLDTPDAVTTGHLDHGLRVALREGARFVDAIQWVTLNAARSFGLDHEIGGLSAGKVADIVLTTGPEDFQVVSVVAKGQLVVDQGAFVTSYPLAEHDRVLLGTTGAARPVTPDQLALRVDGGAAGVSGVSGVSGVRCRAISIAPGFAKRDGVEVTLRVADGVVQADVSQDVLYIVQVERYGINGNIGRGFITGFGLGSGAIASSVAHDNHNVVAVGASLDDVAAAVNRVLELGGGQVVVVDGRVVAEIAYPVAGLLSDLPALEVASVKRELNRVVHGLGSQIELPFMFLSFVPLAAGPGYSITDHGFVDSTRQEVIDPVIAVVA